jgi:hypothetical protein
MQVLEKQTPNPNAMKFTANRVLFRNRLEIEKGTPVDSDLLKRLITLDGVDHLFCCRDFITVSKAPETSWNDLLPHILAIFNQA